MPLRAPPSDGQGDRNGPEISFLLNTEEPEEEEEEAAATAAAKFAGVRPRCHQATGSDGSFVWGERLEALVLISLLHN